MWQPTWPCCALTRAGFLSRRWVPPSSCRSARCGSLSARVRVCVQSPAPSSCFLTLFHPLLRPREWLPVHRSLSSRLEIRLASSQPSAPASSAPSVGACAQRTDGWCEPLAHTRQCMHATHHTARMPMHACHTRTPHTHATRARATHPHRNQATSGTRCWSPLLTPVAVPLPMFVLHFLCLAD